MTSKNVLKFTHKKFHLVNQYISFKITEIIRTKIIDSEKPGIVEVCSLSLPLHSKKEQDSASES